MIPSMALAGMLAATLAGMLVAMLALVILRNVGWINVASDHPAWEASKRYRSTGRRPDALEYVLTLVYLLVLALLDRGYI